MSSVEASIQPDTLAGKFYPNDPNTLRKFMRTHLRKRHFPHAAKLLIMPHAGYRFSSALQARLASEITDIYERIIIISPSHHLAFGGLAISEKSQFETPLGALDVDEKHKKQLHGLPFVKIRSDAFVNEHGIFTILPWIKTQAPSARIAPIVIGQASDDQVETAIARIWGDKKTLIILSTDLSHFHPQREQLALDLNSAQNIELQSHRNIDAQDACGWRGLRAIIKNTELRGMRLTRLGISNSAQITKDTNRVVGYGAWIGHMDIDAEFPKTQRNQLYKIAAQSIAYGTKNDKKGHLAKYSSGHLLETHLASFITLSLNGQLRGCVGSLRAQRPISQDVFDNAYNAAFLDRRFKPLIDAEFGNVECEISILSRPRAVHFANRGDLIAHLAQFPDGLTLRYENQRATFLPKVWEQIASPDQFLSLLFNKARLAEDFWHENLQFETYTAEKFPSIRLKKALKF